MRIIWWVRQEFSLYTQYYLTNKRTETQGDKSWARLQNKAAEPKLDTTSASPKRGLSLSQVQRRSEQCWSSQKAHQRCKKKVLNVSQEKKRKPGGLKDCVLGGERRRRGMAKNWVLGIISLASKRVKSMMHIWKLNSRCWKKRKLLSGLQELIHELLKQKHYFK